MAKEGDTGQGQPDSFDDIVPGGSGQDEFQTFDDLNYDINQPELDDQHDTEGEGEGTEGKEGKEGEVSKDSPQNQLDDKEESAASTESKEKGAQKKEEGNKSPQKKDDKSNLPAGPEGGEAAPAEGEGKKLKAFIGNKAIEIPENAKLKTKVSNKGKMVSIAELKKDYSARTAWDKQFNDLKKEKENFQAEKAQYDKEKNYLIENIQTAKGMADEALKQGGDPMKSINYLLDLMQIDSYSFNKALMNNMAEQVRQLDQMSEAEREAYWVKKENEYLKSKSDNLANQNQQSDQQKALREKVDSLREKHGISREAFTSAYNQLREMGEENIDPERVVRYAHLEPHVETAETLVEPYKEQIDDDEVSNLISSIANTMADHPDVTEDDVKKQLAEIFEVESLTDTINEKAEQVASKGPQEGGGSQSEGLDTFDDFDYY